MTTDKPAEAANGCCAPDAGKNTCCGPSRWIDWALAGVLLAVSYCTQVAWMTKILPVFSKYIAEHGGSYNDIAMFLINSSGWILKIPLLAPLLAIVIAVLVARKCCGRCGAGMLQIFALGFTIFALTTLFFTGGDLAMMLR